MSRPNAFITMTAGVALVFCLACLTGERMGVSQAHAQPAGTPDPAGTPVPLGDPGTGDDPSPEPSPCPPPSHTWTNGSQNPVDVDYTCAGSFSGRTTVPAGHSIEFRDGGCAGAGCGPDCVCIDCGLLQLLVQGQTTPVFTCALQQTLIDAYMEAYGLDLAAVIKNRPLLNVPASKFDENGDPIPQWPVPILDEDRKLVGWQFTTIAPDFLVEDGEVVIRALRTQSTVKDGRAVTIVRKGDIIGGSHGVTVNDRPE